MIKRATCEARTRKTILRKTRDCSWKYCVCENGFLFKIRYNRLKDVPIERGKTTQLFVSESASNDTASGGRREITGFASFLFLEALKWRQSARNITCSLCALRSAYIRDVYKLSRSARERAGGEETVREKRVCCCRGGETDAQNF